MEGNIAEVTNASATTEPAPAEDFYPGSVNGLQ